MNRISNYKIKASQAALWFIGQSGFICKCGKMTLVIDPYLSDSVAKISPRLTRAFPAPIKASDLKADIYIVTHDHLDHLDPETIESYRHKNTTLFVGPGSACLKLHKLGIKNEQIVKIDVGQSKKIRDVNITGIYTVPNEPAVKDTAGYLIGFENGRSFYHSSDTAMSELLLESAPNAEVGLFCINGKWGNLNVEQAVKLAVKMNPRFAVPHHYDVMKLNSENPETFEYILSYTNPNITAKIMNIMEPFIWEC